LILEEGSNRIRRQYKLTHERRRKLVTGEEQHLKEMAAILKIAGYSNQQIGAVVGLAHTQVNEFMRTPDMQELLVELREKIPAAAYNLLQSYSIEAVQAIVDVMRSSTDDKWILQAASDILDRCGLPKMSRSEATVHKTEEQMTTFSDDGITDSLRNASPEVQEKAAQLIEQMESLLEASAGESEN
jgi:hypothetical protein